MADLKLNLKIDWKEGVKGSGTIKGDELNVGIAVPEGTGGSGNGSNPLELLSSSAIACYSMTLVSIMETRKLPVTEYTMDTEVISSDDKISIIHHPKLSLPPNATEKEIEVAHRAFKSADKACSIGNLLKNAGVTIDIDGSVSID